MDVRHVPRPPPLSLSRRSQRQHVVKEILDQLIDGASEGEILEGVNEGDVVYAKKLLRNLDMSNSRANSCSGLLLDAHTADEIENEQKSREPTIDRFLKKHLPHPSKPQDSESIAVLTERFEHLKEENQEISVQIEKSQSVTVLKNLIRLALSHFEHCKSDIISKYNGSKNYQMLRQETEGRVEQTCQEFLLNEAKIRDLNREIEQLNGEITQAQNFCLQTAYREVKMELAQELKDARRQSSFVLEGIESNQILVQQYKYVTQMNFYRGNQLPAFYPVAGDHATEVANIAPLTSSQTDYSYEGQPYLLLELIGKGGFSSVFKAFNIHTSGFVALKVTQVEITEGAAISEKRKLARREAEIHRALEHSNILKVFNTDLIEYQNEAQKTIEESYIEMELCDGPTLFQYICLKRYLVDVNGRFPQSQALGILVEIAGALSYLHDEIGVVHNDISLSNIIMSNGVWKISDFTLAKRGNAFKEDVTTLGCTVPYVAPEVERERKFSVESDIFSLGVCVFGLLTGGIDIFQQRDRTKAENLQYLAKEQLDSHGTSLYDAEPDFVEFLIEMLDSDAEKRPTAERIYEFCKDMLEAGSVKKLK